MPRYAAFLRGVMPTNASMPELRRAFEAAGFGNVKTVLGSGNVVFDARKASEAALEKKAEAAMQRHLGKSFYTIVRPVADLERLLAADPYAPFEVAANAKRVVTFVRAAPAAAKLPEAQEGARILCVRGREIFTAYVPGAKTPVFMTLLLKTFGREQTTRTWETVGKVAKA